MRGRLSCCWLVVLLSVGAFAAFGQAAKGDRTSVAVDGSKAGAWAERVARFVANPRLRESFRGTDVAEKFEALMPASSLKIINSEVGSGSDLKNGIVDFEYNLDDLGDEKKGFVAISWFTIYLPTADPDGVDVFTRVKGAVKQRLPRAWRFSVLPNKGCHWERREAFSIINVELVAAHPNREGTATTGEQWVAVHFGIVDSFEKGE